MRVTIIDHTDDWDTDVTPEKLTKDEQARNPRLGFGYVYKLKVRDEDVFDRVVDGNDYEVALSVDGSKPVEFSKADVSSMIYGTDTIYFSLYDVASVGHVLSEASASQ